eukprot:GHVN01068223.1.p1 GENE.GHVN01068223.1~~GHVN01068223.1.p1  ORF type:complete len:805 (+),score=55.08 GHVN01068223.1:1506-3920(+)
MRLAVLLSLVVPLTAQPLFHAREVGHILKGVTGLVSPVEVHIVTHEHGSLRLPRESGSIPAAVDAGEHLLGFNDLKGFKYAAIMFYASWCPHCHHMAPKWTEIALSYGCDPEVRFFAFECDEKEARKSLTPDSERSRFVDQDPTELCGQFLVSGYPTFYLFELPGDPTEPTQMTSMTQSSLSDTISELTGISTCPGGNSTNTNTSVNTEERVVDRRWESSATRQSPDIRLHDALVGLRFILEHWVPLASRQFDHGTIVMRKAELSLLERFLKALVIVLPGHNLRMELIRLTAVVSLHIEPLTAPLTLDSYLKAVSELSFGGIFEPVNLYKQHSVAHEIDAVTSVDQLKERGWVDVLLNEAGGNPRSVFVSTPPSSALLACSGKTCAVWTLLHIAAVGLERTAVARHGWRSDTEPSRTVEEGFAKEEPTPLTSGESLDLLLRSVEAQSVEADAFGVLGVIHDAIFKFFACARCQKHFHAAYVGCLYSRCKWVTEKGNLDKNVVFESMGFENSTEDHELASEIGLNLYFWRLHNGVTLRTAAESTNRVLNNQQALGDKDYLGVDVLFPPKSQCIICRTDSTQNTTVTPGMIQLGDEAIENVVQESVWDQYANQFDLPAVHNFLHAFYWSDIWDSATAFASFRRSEDSTSADKRTREKMNLIWQSKSERFVVEWGPDRGLWASFKSLLAGKDEHKLRQSNPAFDVTLGESFPYTPPRTSVSFLAALFAASALMLLLALCLIQTRSRCNDDGGLDRRRGGTSPFDGGKRFTKWTQIILSRLKRLTMYFRPSRAHHYNHLSVVSGQPAP